MLDGVTKTIKDVHSDILELISAQDIVICHSHDLSFSEVLMVLHLVHGKVVDTSHVYPHRDGPHKRNSIRFLAKEYLRRTIQDKSQDLDHIEEALAILDLMKAKVKI